MSERDETIDERPDEQKEWEEMIAGMSDEERTEWSRRQYEAAEARGEMGLDDDDELEAKMAAMTDDERIVYVRGICEAISTDPTLSSIIPPEFLDEMKATLEKYERQNDECKRLEQRSRIANALRDSTGDSMLIEMLDDKKGH
jgi:hypothetical protein